jgi:hypothetical protein
MEAFQGILQFDVSSLMSNELRDLEVEYQLCSHVNVDRLFKLCDDLMKPLCTSSIIYVQYSLDDL